MQIAVVDNHNPRNWYYLHICNVMNIMTCNKTQIHPHVVVQIHLLHSIKATQIVIVFELSNKEHINHDLSMDYIDTFYLCYAFYGRPI